MIIAVKGGDRRYAALAELLRARGHTVTDDVTAAELVVTGFPNDLLLLNGAEMVCCGPRTAPEGTYDVMKDEEYLVNIAALTAEGAISAAMAASDCALLGARCLVAGWGRIGRALTSRLTGLGAQVTVLSRRESNADEISRAGAVWMSTSTAAKVIPGHRFVFSTPPSMIFDGEALKNADRDALVMDLASPPYGVDIDAARALGMKAWREPGLPGRYCPESAARAILASMIRGGVLDG